MCELPLQRERENLRYLTESRTGEEPLIDQSKENYPPQRKYF